MFKGMQRGFVCACLLILFVAPTIHADGDERGIAPWTSFAIMLSDILEGIQQELNDIWLNAFETSESGVPPEPVPPEEATPQATSGEPPTPPPEEEDENGGGADPWG